MAWLAAATLLGGLGAASEDAAAASARLVRIGTFQDPVYVTGPPGDPSRVMVVERAGRIMIVRDGQALRDPFLDISSRVRSGGERGLLSVAFAPDYAAEGRLYVYFSDRDGDIRVEEYRAGAGADRADPATRRAILSQEHSRYPNHYGGQLQFGPDGLLYVSVGDGGGAGNPLRSAQSRGSLLGKILRIDPDPPGGRAYAVPASNPYARVRGARPEIYALGLRNPWRFSFDRLRGDMVVADVGQNAIEEVDFLRRGRARGANFGWNRFEGRRRFSRGALSGRHVRPVLQRTHSRGWCSIVGGYVVRDRSLRALYGRYVYGDFCRPGLRSAQLLTRRAGADRAVGVGPSGLTSFGEDAAGRVYVASLHGPVYRLAAP